jgi:hypothetical protein
MMDKLALISRALSSAPPGAKQSMFVDRVSTIGGTIGISPEIVGQKLWDIATAHKLTGEPGSGSEEFIEGLIESAVARVRDEPRASNGGDDHGEPIAPAQRTGKTEKPKRSPLKLTYFDDSAALIEKRWILKGLLALGETSALIGPPGAGKSALQTEIAIHCAAQRDWRGHKAKAACGVVIFALERADLYRRRLQAYRTRDELQGLPIAVAGSVIDLLNHNCVDIIVSTVREAERIFKCDTGLIIFDTYAKGIAANGGDEDKARDQNRAAANLRNVQAQLNVHIALVGHTGKQEDRGARGSNAHLGDVDVMVQISGEAIKIAEVTKANDQPERVLAEFKMQVIETGRDEDGDPVTTSIVSPGSGDAPPATAARKKTKLKLADKPKAGLRALLECIADCEAPIPTDQHVPATAKGVTLTTWRDRLEKTRIINPKGNPRQEFQRIHVTLKNAGVIGIWEEFVWAVT